MEIKLEVNDENTETRESLLNIIKEHGSGIIIKALGEVLMHIYKQCIMIIKCNLYYSHSKINFNNIL